MPRWSAGVMTLLIAGACGSACDKARETETEPDEPEASQQPSAKPPAEPANMAATDFCKLIFEAPLRALDKSCGDDDKKTSRYRDVKRQTRDRVQACWTLLSTGVREKRVTLPATAAKRCASALEKKPWHEAMQAPLAEPACRTIAIGLSGAGKACRTTFECSPGNFCSGATKQTDGVCMKKVASSDSCQSAAFTELGDTEAACEAGLFCDHGGKLASFAPPTPAPSSPWGGFSQPPSSSSTKPPRVRMGATSVSGRLPPEVIQRIVRSNFGRFRVCYQTGLKANPNLQGRVSVRFVIGRDGSVSSVSGSGDIPDQAVVSCVTRAFYGLSFPQPEGGIVTVSYPIVFSPGSGATGSAPPPGVKMPPLTNTCTAMRKEGDACRGARECHGELACVAGKCGPLAAEGAECWGHDECGPKLRCVTQKSEEPAEGEDPPPLVRKCEKVVDIDGVCSVDADCEGACANGKCKSFCGG